MATTEARVKESPEYLRMSLAAAMTLDYVPGIFYRNAKLYCINLLLTYGAGCGARCAYCGLSKKRSGEYTEKSFIRVSWPTYALDDIIERIRRRPKRVKRVCLSMITHKRSVQDTKDICTRIRDQVDVPVSLLVAPTVICRDDLVAFQAAGADKVGVAVDLATPVLFDKFRGTGVGGPHQWERYWQCYADALAVFGRGNAGVHLMTGMGETEAQMVRTMQRARDMGGCTHLFSYFPEAESQMGDHPMPPMDQYRRIQLARYLIDKGLSHQARFAYNAAGRILEFGLEAYELDTIIESGEPFRTSGCEGRDGEVACNRPFGNSRPGPDIRNFPFATSRKDIQRIRKQMGLPPSDDEADARKVQHHIV